MAKRTRQLTIALLLTVLEGVVALRYGRVIWTVWSGIIWTRLLMCFLAAIWLTSLANVWACAARRCERSLARPQEWFVPGAAANSAEAYGEADV
ncbi:MAG: hypothetical protein ACYCPD_01690 [Acidobacteriaceae bacterium]